MGNAQNVKAKVAKLCDEDDAVWSAEQRRETILKLVQLHDNILADTGNQDKSLDAVKAEYLKLKQAALHPRKIPKQVSVKGDKMIKEIFSTKKDAEGAAAAAAAVSADQVAITSAAAAPSEEECPICMEMCPDVQRLKHANDATKPASFKTATASHKACASCRKQMVMRNQKCPWCREDVVWRSVFGFLDGLKKNIGKAHTPDELADLMTHWQEYEMMRSTSDVIIFAGHMVHDLSLCKHLDRVIKDNTKDFLRDSAGLWCRFNALIQDGELVVEDETFSRRMKNSIEIALSNFDLDGGRSPHHGGAMYAQIAVAVLCGSMKGMSTKTMVNDCRRVGKAFINFWSKSQKHITEVKPHLPCMYVEGVSCLVWGSHSDDPILRTFYPQRYNKLCK